MSISPISCTTVSFQGYKHPLKTLWKRNLIPQKKVRRDLYGDLLTVENATLEHLQAHSPNVPEGGGHTVYSNLALATRENNSLRGCAPLRKFLTWAMAERYLKQFEGITVEGSFDWVKYTEGVRRTLTKLLGPKNIKCNRYTK